MGGFVRCACWGGGWRVNGCGLGYMPAGRFFLYAYGVGLCLVCLPARRLFVCVPTALAFP
jgi:hypothetical protein